MSEDRLLEILSTIDRLEGPLMVLGYLVSLDNFELFEVIRMIDKDSKNNFYDGIKAVASEYMKDKPPLSDSSLLEKIGYSVYKEEKKNDSPMFDTKYAEMLLCNDHTSTDESSRSRK